MATPGTMAEQVVETLARSCLLALVHASSGASPRASPRASPHPFLPAGSAFADLDGRFTAWPPLFLIPPFW